MKKTIPQGIKLVLAKALDVTGVLEGSLRKLNKRYHNDYIRVINYHDTVDDNADSFEAQLKWYKEHYVNTDFNTFKCFIDKRYHFDNKPGLMLTFDDGKRGNYDCARDLLKKYGFTGYFMCSSDLINTEGYMDKEQILTLVREGHIIGDHTATHHRMNEMDEDSVLYYEISESKQKLEDITGEPVEIFCWCGGEEQYYTKRAYDIIKGSGYRYGFMTNSYPVVSDTDPYHIQRINVEDEWNLSVTKFQVCGMMDIKLKKKRIRVDNHVLGLDK